MRLGGDGGQVGDVHAHRLVDGGIQTTVSHYEVPPVNQYVLCDHHVVRCEADARGVVPNTDIRCMRCRKRSAQRLGPNIFARAVVLVHRPVARCDHARMRTTIARISAWVDAG